MTSLITSWPKYAMRNVVPFSYPWWRSALGDITRRKIRIHNFIHMLRLPKYVQQKLTLNTFGGSWMRIMWCEGNENGNSLRGWNPPVRRQFITQKVTWYSISFYNWSYWSDALTFTLNSPLSPFYPSRHLIIDTREVLIECLIIFAPQAQTPIIRGSALNDVVSHVSTLQEGLHSFQFPCLKESNE